MAAAFLLAGFVKGALVKTGDRTFCFIGEWNSMQDIAASRTAMIALALGPSPPKLSLTSTLIVTGTSSVVEATSFTAAGTSPSGSETTVMFTVAVEVSPLASVIV